jgi:hypothetical protein
VCILRLPAAVGDATFAAVDAAVAAAAVAVAAVAVAAFTAAKPKLQRYLKNKTLLAQ